MDNPRNAVIGARIYAVFLRIDPLACHFLSWKDHFNMREILLGNSIIPAILINQDSLIQPIFSSDMMASGSAEVSSYAFITCFT